MASYTRNFPHTTGLTLSAFPLRTTAGAVVSLATWNTNRVACTESSSPNVGLYSVTVTDTFPEWAILEAGGSQPADWSVDTGWRINISSDATATVELPPVNLLPFIGSVPDRANETTLTAFIDELPTLTVALDGAELDGLTLEFNIDAMDGTHIDNITGIAAAGESFEVTLPSTIMTSVNNYRWSLRDQTNSENLVLGYGILQIIYAAYVHA